MYGTDHRDWKLGSTKEFLSLCSTSYVTDLWRLEIALAKIISDHRQYKGWRIHWKNHEPPILAKHWQTAARKGWGVDDALGGREDKRLTGGHHLLIHEGRTRGSEPCLLKLDDVKLPSVSNWNHFAFKMIFQSFNIGHLEQGSTALFFSGYSLLDCMTKWKEPSTPGTSCSKHMTIFMIHANCTVQWCLEPKEVKEHRKRYGSRNYPTLMTCFPGGKLKRPLHVAICTLKIGLDELRLDHWVAHLSFLFSGSNTSQNL